MSVVPSFKDERGFTIQELMVVLIVGSLLVSFSFSLFLFSQKLFVSWQKKSDVQVSVTRVLQYISLDVLQSKYIIEASDTLLSLTAKAGINVRYSFDGKHVWRNGDAIDPGKEITFEVSVTQKNDVQKYPPLLLVTVKGKSKSFSYASETEITMPLSSKASFISETN